MKKIKIVLVIMMFLLIGCESSNTEITSKSGISEANDSASEIIVSENETSETETVDREQMVQYDKISPEIELIGKRIIEIYLGEKYVDEGALVSDQGDDIYNKLIFSESKINFDEIGSYELHYEYQDSSGNTSERLTRIITILPQIPLKQFDFDGLASNYNLKWGSQIEFVARDISLRELENLLTLRGEYSGNIDFDINYLDNLVTITPKYPLRSNEMYTLEIKNLNGVFINNDSYGVSVRFKFGPSESTEFEVSRNTVISSDRNFLYSTFDIDKNGSLNFVSSTSRSYLVDNEYFSELGIQTYSPEIDSWTNQSGEYTKDFILGIVDSSFPKFVAVSEIYDNSLYYLYTHRKHLFEVDESILYGYSPILGITEIYKGASGPVYPNYEAPFSETNYVNLTLLDSLDVNYDGVNDLLISEDNTSKSDYLVLLYSSIIDGEITYVPKILINDGEDLNARFVDWDNDYQIDIVVINNSNLYLLKNNNNDHSDSLLLDQGRFSSRTMLINDFDSDGFLDVISRAGNSINIGYNRIDRVETKSILTDSIITSVTAGDINADGNIDIIYATQPNNTIFSSNIYLVENLGNEFALKRLISNESRGSIMPLLIVDIESRGRLSLVYNNQSGLNRRY